MMPGFRSWVQGMENNGNDHSIGGAKFVLTVIECQSGFKE
jgi:hypothetical protein